MIKGIRLEPGRYRLYRLSDNAGDTGGYVVSIDPVTNTAHANEIQIGECFRVGSMYSRTFAQQDYWTTTPVTKFLSIEEGVIKFQTKNSVYILEQH